MSTVVNLRNPAYATTLDNFINIGKDIPLTYSKLCLKETLSNGLIKITHNFLSDYIEDLQEYLITINLSDEEVLKYRFKPKVLAFDAYGLTDYYSFILFFNGLNNVKEFTLETKSVKMMRLKDMNNLLSAIKNNEHIKIEL